MTGLRKSHKDSCSNLNGGDASELNDESDVVIWYRQNDKDVCCFFRPFEKAESGTKLSEVVKRYTTAMYH